ncbi:SseB family protein [Streptomyces sp. NPDC054933]
MLNADEWDRLLNPFRYDEQGRLTDHARRGDTSDAATAGAEAKLGPGSASRASLPLEIAAFYRQQGYFEDLLGAFRDTEVLVPVRDERLRAVVEGGVLWTLAFSGEADLAAFLTARGESSEGGVYVRLTGAQLLDVAVPEADGPAGVALDVGGVRPVLFPPVAGIVSAASVVAGREGA